MCLVVFLWGILHSKKHSLVSWPARIQNRGSPIPQGSFVAGPRRETKKQALSKFCFPFQAGIQQNKCHTRPSSESWFLASSQSKRHWSPENAICVWDFLSDKARQGQSWPRSTALLWCLVCIVASSLKVTHDTSLNPLFSWICCFRQLDYRASSCICRNDISFSMKQLGGSKI